jgi:hypothetical protein
MYTHYWVTASKQATEQHLLIGNRFLMSKYTQQLLSIAFANKHVPMETIGMQNEQCFIHDLYQNVIRSTIGARVRESVKRRLSQCSCGIFARQ